ncbi:DUF2946 family protein [Bradyrhizobium sp. NP1]|uniref:DUF2946 family protein n=1 Tax=Bradyrhizobium sp. NP1 TaxID=3049772 RepID=UPI0025A5E7AC|nr:DUF2946 family protein [Bradyrhizobium sp. NP1]WJR80094.1 DUF2946 family protein [Bradyrhizobium sp. NP1]
MKWFRRHVKTGARLALFALAVQCVLSFGHFHPLAAQAAPAVRAGLTQADRTNVAIAPDTANQAVWTHQPSGRDGDQQPGEPCAICAVISLASNVLFATPPLLLLPQAVELLYFAADTEFTHLESPRSAFQSRAPPLS